MKERETLFRIASVIITLSILLAVAVHALGKGYGLADFHLASLPLPGVTLEDVREPGPVTDSVPDQVYYDMKGNKMLRCELWDDRKSCEPFR